VRALSLLTLVVLLVVGCSRAPTQRASTERERDSIIGESRLPGASGVRGALRVSDSAVSRNARIDSAGQP